MKKSLVSVQLLTLREVATRLRRSVTSLRRDIRSRRIDTVKIGRTRRVPIEAVEKLISDGWTRAK